VGKRGGCQSTPQTFIEQRMIREARAAEIVVRFKGGDRFVFGRGGEEMRGRCRPACRLQQQR
jgi:uroporphyrin-III C-methyltransferase